MKRKLHLFFTILFLFGSILNSYSQTKEEKVKIIEQTKVNYLLDYAKEKSEKHKLNKAKALELAKEKGWIISKQIKGGNFMELQGVTEDGRPLYYITHNANAAVSTATDKVHSGGGLGLSLDGTGMVAGEWDGGDVLTTHQEFNNTGSSRVNDRDGVSTTHYHSTHVAGTIMAGGVEAAAKGMAYNASLDAYDWDDDESEMAIAAANGLLISNHSYGFSAGWVWNGSGYDWVGNAAISTEEDYRFGFYGSYCAELDDIANNAPSYLVVKSSGNDQGDGDGETEHPKDGGAAGYDCISYKGNAKNILTVGAVYDVSGGYTQPSDVTLADFSSTGPCDDSRIKPDIVGNGVAVYSTFDGNDTEYGSISGTSMSSPNVTGSLLLLQEHYNESFGSFMKAATLKALAIHTTDECGANEGPDYKFGWGLLNTGTAANVISEKYVESYINEETYTGTTYTLDVEALGTEPLVVTIVWSDPAGTPAAAALDPTDIMLVNDLDMSITGTGGPYYPYMLSAAAPSAPATTGNNDVDNVEKIYIASPTAGTYTINITHEETITGGTQDFSIIVTGVEVTSDEPIVTTAIPSSIDLTSAVSGGNVFNEGASSIIQRGVVWSTSETPTLSDNVVVDGETGEGTYSSLISGLTAVTKYYVRAFATNTNGTGYGDEFSFTTSCTAPATQASGISASTIDFNDITLTWTSGSDHVLLIAKAGSAVDVDPFRGETYAANSNITLGEDLNFGNIAVYSGTDETISITNLVEATEYHFALYKYNDAEKCYNITSPATVAVKTAGYCAAGSQKCDELISRVELHTIDNSSDCDNYQDFTSESTDLGQELPYSIVITNEKDFDGDIMGCWIDWNQDWDFDDANEEIEISYDSGVGTGAVVVPADAVLGETRMRVRVQYEGTPVSCGLTEWGEVEDYTINVFEPVLYEAKFKVINSTGNIENAKITLRSAIDKYTDSQGEALFSLGAGTYSYSVSVASNYTQTGSIEVVDKDIVHEIRLTGLSINDNIYNSVFKIYPNPTTGILKIQGEGLTRAKISVYDMVGKQILSRVSENSEIGLDISEFSNGIYIIQIETGEGIYKQKLIKE